MSDLEGEAKALLRGLVAKRGAPRGMGDELLERFCLRFGSPEPSTAA